MHVVGTGVLVAFMKFSKNWVQYQQIFSGLLIQYFNVLVIKIIFKFSFQNSHLLTFLPNHTCKHFASDSFYFTFTKLSFNSFNFVIWNGSPFRFDNCQYEWMRQNYNQVKQFLVYITYNLVSCLSWQKVRVP